MSHVLVRRIGRSPGVAVWVLQLVFPLLGVSYVAANWIGAGTPGFWSRLGLGLCAAWCAACLGSLCIESCRRWISQRTRQLAVLYCAVLMGLLAGELLCRLIPVHSPESSPYVPHSEYCRELGWRLTPGKASVGAHGWRLPQRALGKLEGRFRIVAIGDSTTFGNGCAWDDTWVHQLETLLNEDDQWRQQHGHAEAVNLGVGGYGPDQALLALRKHGLSYDPDVVIFHLCVNDFADAYFDHDWRMFHGVTRYKPRFAIEDGRLEFARDHAPPPRTASGERYHASPERRRTFAVRSALLTVLARSLPNLRHRPSPGTQPGTAAEHCRHLTHDYWPVHEGCGFCRSRYSDTRPLVWGIVRRMAAVCEEAGAVLLVSLSPTHIKTRDDGPRWRVASFLTEFRRDAAAAGVPVTECVGEFFELGGRPRFVLDDDPSHLNAEGNALVARSTMRLLQSASALQEERDGPEG